MFLPTPDYLKSQEERDKDESMFLRFCNAIMFLLFILLGCLSVLMVSMTYQVVTNGFVPY